jgi:hypothetical protein
MYSRYSDVILKNDMWRNAWIRNIERILMILKSNIPKNGAKEEFPRIEPLTSRFPLNVLDLDFYAQKFQIKVYKHCKTVPYAYACHYILLLANPLILSLIIGFIKTQVTQPFVAWITRSNVEFTCL